MPAAEQNWPEANTDHGRVGPTIQGANSVERNAPKLPLGHEKASKEQKLSGSEK